MYFKELLDSSGVSRAFSQSDDFEVKGIACNSQFVGEGFVFVAINGNRHDGRIFIQQTIQRGARGIVCEPPINPGLDLGRVSLVHVKDARKALADLASSFYGAPSLKLNVVGITGTNGKTTVTYLIESILKQAKHKPAVIGTINCRLQDKVVASDNTTPGPLELQSLLSGFLEGGADHLVMEVSSHALKQERTRGIEFSSAIFTNLTQDHLDYHLTLEDYFESKAKLFKGLSSKAAAIINSDDAFSCRIPGLTSARIISYGIRNKSDVMAKDIQLCSSGTKFRIEFSNKKGFDVQVALIGLHNVYNILAAVAWAASRGISNETIRAALANFIVVPGRLEKFTSPDGYSVFVDYAHTEDALRSVIVSLRQLVTGRLIVVFGCGGERDKDKRPKMGRVASDMADFCIITNDNPRSEDPDDIINQIKQGIKKDNYEVIPDRVLAIKKALSIASKGDIVLIAGKGHENYQLLKDGRHHFDDREAVRECLKSQRS